jgi:hypothetical protein
MQNASRTLGFSDPVVWLITTPAFVRAGWEDVRRRLGPVDGVVVESNSLALCLQPDLTFFTINPRVPRSRWKASAPRSRWKASAPLLIEQSDVVIISRHDTGREQAHELIADIETKRQGHGVVMTEAVEHAVDMPEVSRRLQALL